ncbi:MAG: hypothetical protein ACE5HO_13965 [bacterium]
MKKLKFFLFFSTCLVSTYAAAQSPIQSGQVRNFLSELNLRVRSSYDYQTLSFSDHRANDSDQKFYQYLSINTVGKGLKNLNTFFSLRYESDIDGTALSSQFRNSTDFFPGRNDLRLYYAYADYAVNALQSNFALRVGRQSVRDAETVYFDGAKLGLKFKNKVQVTFFRGKRVSHYTNPPKDDVWGTSVRLDLTRSTYFKFSHVKYIARSTEFLLDHSLATNLFATARLAMINSDLRDFTLDVDYFLDRTGTELFLSYYRKIGRSNDDFDFDYTSSDLSSKDLTVRRLLIKDLAPFQDFSFKIQQTLFGGLMATGELLVRDLVHKDLENEYNYPFQQYRVSLSASNFPWKGSHFEMRFLRWQADRMPVDPAAPFDQPVGEGEPDYDEVGFAASQRVLPRLTLGTQLLYRVYAYRGRYVDAENVNSLFIGGQGIWEVYANVLLQVRYGREDDFLFINPNLKSVTRFTTQLKVKF